MEKRKIALFGGTFDPIHLGHTAVAAAAADYVGAEKVIFIPTKRSPLKESLPGASDDHRLAMISLAIAGNDKFQLSDCELNKPQPGYTLLTVRRFQEEYGSDTSLYWLIGADSTDDLSRWYRILDLIDECNLAVMCRAGFELPDFAPFESVWGSERIRKLQQNVIPTPLIDISSTDIRNRLVSGQDVTNMLHPAVADYICRHALYQSEVKP